MITIRSTDNEGFIITYPNPNGEGTVTYCFSPKEAWEPKEIGLEECKVLRDLLYTVKEGLGLYYSDHNPYNVVIKIEDSDGNLMED